MSSVTAPVNAGALLHDLVAIPSLSGQETEAVNWLVERAAALGYAAHVDPAGNAVATRGSGSREILLLGHIDTVPGEIPVRVEDGVLYGRGAVDAKGPLAAFVAGGAAAELPEGVKLTVIGAVGEESYGSPGATWLRDHYPVPAAVVIGEPSGWDGVVLGYKGSIGFTATVERGITHSAGPDSTASELLFDFWRAVTDWLSDYNGEIEPGFNSLDGTLRSLDSGNDGLHEWASTGVTFRLPPGTASESVREEMNRIAGEHGVNLNWSFNAEAYRTDRKSPLVAPFLAAIRAAGGKGRLKVKTGTADMNIVGPAWGCPIIAYGPGDASYDHTPNEQISLAELDLGAAVLTRAIEAYALRLATETGEGP